MPKDGAAVSKR